MEAHAEISRSVCRPLQCYASNERDSRLKPSNDSGLAWKFLTSSSHDALRDGSRLCNDTEADSDDIHCEFTQLLFLETAQDVDVAVSGRPRHRDPL